MLKWYSPTVAFRNVCIFEYWSCDCLCARVCCPCRSIWVNSVQCSFRWSFTNAIYFGCLHPYNVFWLVCGKYLFQHTNEIYDSSTEHIIVIIKYVFCHGVNKNKTSRHEKKHTHTHTHSDNNPTSIIPITITMEKKVKTMNKVWEHDIFMLFEFMTNSHYITDTQC